MKSLLTCLAVSIPVLTACGGPGGEINVLGDMRCFGELKRDVDDLDGDGVTNECIDKACNHGAPHCAKYDVQDSNHNLNTCECVQ
jgi:hypothetical protein